MAKDDLAAIGLTNDAILYGARVTLYVTGDDEAVAEVGPKRSPACSSRDFGEPFAAIFSRYNHDFYAVDPHLFSPAEVVFQNLDTEPGPCVREDRAGRKLCAVVLLVTRLVALVSGFGWHVQAPPTQAADGLGIELSAIPFPETHSAGSGRVAGSSTRGASR